MRIMIKVFVYKQPQSQYIICAPVIDKIIIINLVRPDYDFNDYQILMC